MKHTVKPGGRYRDDRGANAFQTQSSRQLRRQLRTVCAVGKILRRLKYRFDGFFRPHNVSILQLIRAYKTLAPSCDGTSLWVLRYTILSDYRNKDRRPRPQAFGPQKTSLTTEHGCDTCSGDMFQGEQLRPSQPCLVSKTTSRRSHFKFTYTLHKG